MAGHRKRVAAPYGDAVHNWPCEARKRTGEAESDWHPPPDKNIEPVGQKNSTKSFFVNPGRELQ